jgi:hypothetical protein
LRGIIIFFHFFSPWVLYYLRVLFAWSRRRSLSEDFFDFRCITKRRRRLLNLDLWDGGLGNLILDLWVGSLGDFNCRSFRSDSWSELNLFNL